MKVIIAGSRTIREAKLLENAWFEFVWTIGHVTEIVSGHCPAGIDVLGEELAEARDIKLTLFPANWVLGKAAGPIRNRQMAEYADALILVWDGKSKGSRNMLKEAQARGLKILNRVVAE